MTTDDKDLVLLPCPFCGSEAAYNRGRTAIRCTSCWADGPATTPEGIAERWNTRPEAADRIEQLSSGGWMPIETAQMWEVVVVTDGEQATVAQLSLNDWREKFWSCDPEDGLDWEPTHWQPLPALQSLQVGGGE